MDVVTVQDLARHLQNPADSVQLVDVREPHELEIAQLPGFTNLPLSAYEEWSQKIQVILEPDQEIWVLCHHGMRSARMCQWLMSQGYTQVKNITGGIHAYSAEIDRKIPVY
ncbi:MAG: rhodanese-related sulfurtransferase [Oscillatoriales cyanobacterium]|nr:MAG: rhodanese-related sulfurtransferase [Oscillatoriales cyanobacterium]